MMFKRFLQRNASTITLGGIFLFFSILLFLTLCAMPCEYTHHKEHQHRQHSQQNVVHTKSYKAFLVVLVMTGPKHITQRDTLRQTWLSAGRSRPDRIRHFFPIGTAGLSTEEQGTLTYERNNNEDLLLLPGLKDSYHTLSAKLLQSLAWLDANVEFDFVLKADDDTYARLEILESELRAREESDKETLYWGFFDGRANVKKTGKWAEPDWVLCDTYLPYARGGGYVLGTKLVHFIASNAEYLKLYKSEDVSLGAWLAGVKVNRVHDPRFDTEYKSRGCHNDYIVTHKQDGASLIQKHKNLKDLGRLCIKEFRTRYSYVYNWNVHPSQCCVRNDTSVP